MSGSPSAVSVELRHRPLVFVADPDRPVLDDADHHHLSRSLRVAVGDPIVVADGAGRWRLARFGPEPEPEGDVRSTSAPAVTTTVGFTPVKGQRPEWFAQKLTELGVGRIVVLETDRSVVRWDKPRQAKAVDRMSRACREACMQCRRLHLPAIDGPVDIASFVSQNPGAVLADPAGGSLAGAATAIAVGPEGGFSESERNLTDLVALPGHILRAETAAVVAAALVVGR